MKTKKALYAVLVISPVLLRSGCNPMDWFKGKGGGEIESKKEMFSEKKVVGGGDWIVKVGNEVAVSSNDFEKEFNALLDEKPNSNLCFL